MFWVLKLLTTGRGEVMSDFLGEQNVVIAGCIGLFGTLLALRLQLRQDRYRAPYYWTLCAFIAIFGTMIADAIHDGAALGYFVTVPLFAAATAAVFVLWYRREGTLSIHTITTRRRELYYWAAVFGTFTLGTAAGDMTAASMGLGYFTSVLLFFAIIAIPLIGWRRFHWNPIFSFWFAYITTRPIGASMADWTGKPADVSGLGLGEGIVSAVALVVFIGLVVWVTVHRHGVQAAEFDPALGIEAA
jgi:uncharacterized membrane-anchored protein